MSNPTPGQGATLRLSFLFGTLYFVQGFGEPTEGLIAQPTRSILRGWGWGVDEIATFMALLALPWSLKPLFGLVSDFIPLAGTHRRNYLLLTTLMTTLGLFGVWAMDLPVGAARLLFLLLFLPTFGVAFSDVVADAHMIERGKPLGITGRLQSVQWASIYGAGVITGFLGGWLTYTKREPVGFLLCSGLTLLSFAACFGFVREEPRAKPAARGIRDALWALWGAAKSPVVLGVGGFLFLLNFNPFSSTILNHHVTEVLKLTDLDYGTSLTCFSLGCIAACLAYAVYCRMFPLRLLVHMSIVMGIFATLLYWQVSGRVSLFVVSTIVGFCYMTAGLVSLDLAARACDPETAGTVFALLMALCNTSVSLSSLVGGKLYPGFEARWGSLGAFKALVLVGASCTAMCWIMMRVLPGLDEKIPLPEADPPVAKEVA